MASLKQIKNELDNKKIRSAWNRGVLLYALELFDNIEEHSKFTGLSNYDAVSLYKIMLNGAKDWHEYSYGGCSLIYDTDIAEQLCNPTELKRTDNGNKQPNKNETWLDVQARALNQACHLIQGITYQIDRKAITNVSRETSKSFK